MQRFIKNIPYLLCYLCAFALGMKQLREPDIWWQLLSGRWMLDNGAITRTDMFSYTMAGHPWINVKWLYEILIGIIEKASGPEGVILLQCIVNVLIVYLLQKTLQFFIKEQKETLPVFPKVIAMLLFLSIVEYRMAGRPEMISHLMCTLYLFLLWRSPSFEWKKIFWLVPLQCIWANMHEGYPVGMVIIGTYAAGNFLSYILNKDKGYLQQAIRASVVFIAAGLVILLNPNGIQLWKQPFEIYRQVWANKYTTELYSVSNPEYWTIEAKWHIGLLCAVIAFWIMRLAEHRKNKNLVLSPALVTYLLLIPLFGYLSLTANRNIPFAQIVLFPSVPLMGMWLAARFKLNKQPWFAVIDKQAVLLAGIVGMVFYVCIVTDRFYKYTDSPNRYGMHISMMHNPTGAAAYIREHKISGLPFSDYFVSSYLLWDLFPGFRSYIDLRDLDVFPVKFFDDYFSMYNNPDKFNELDRKYNFNYIVLSTSQLIPLQQRLYWGEEYNLVYIDPVACIYLKKTEENMRINADFSAQKLFSWPAAIEDAGWAEAITKALNPVVNYADEDESNAPVRAAMYYNQMRNYPTSLKLLLPQMADHAEDADAFATLGTTYLDYASVVKNPAEKSAKLDSARMLFEQAIALDNKKANAYLSLGSVLMMQGDFVGAGIQFQSYIDINKNNPQAYFLLGICARETWKKGEGSVKEVIRAFRKSLDLNDENGKAHLYLAEAYVGDAERDKARQHLMKAVKQGASWTPSEQQLIAQLKKHLNLP